MSSSVSLPDFRICPYHSLPLNHFCELCNAPICSDCNHNSHKNHKTIPFMQKSQDLIERLHLIISQCTERDKEIQRRYSVLDKYHQDIETSTTSAVEQMDAKHKFVRAELDRVYNEELDWIYKLKREEQLKLQTEITQLEMKEKYHKDAEENARRLLTETGCFDFIDRCDTFLTYNPLKAMPEDRHKVWKRLLYRHPSYNQTINIEDFRIYVKNHILGYFSSEGEEQTIEKGTSKESKSTALCEMRKYDSFTGSLHSLSSSSSSSIKEAKSIPFPDFAEDHFKMCPDHINFPFNHFCKQCNDRTCTDCNQSSYRSHKTDSLAKLTKDLIERLRSVLMACHEQEHEIEKKISSLKKYIQDIEDTTTMAIQQMDEQCKQITAEIGRVYNVQVDVINKVKREEQYRFETEMALLKNLNKYRKDIEETSSQLLEVTKSPDFISRSNAFLSQTQLKKLPEDRMKIWKGYLFRHPSYKKALNPEQFLEYVLQHIRGYFVPNRPGQLSRDNTHPSLDHLTRERNIQSSYSVGASFQATTWSGTSRLSADSGFPGLDEQAVFPTQTSTKPTRKTLAELVSYVNLEKFEDSHLKFFSSALFTRQSMWICGWKNKGGLFAKSDTVLLKVEVPDYKTIMKRKNDDLRAELPIIMTPFRDNILLATKAGSKIYSFNPNSQKFEYLLGGDDLAVAAMCSNKDCIFVLNPKQADHIRVFDCILRADRKIPTGLGDVRKCQLDICLISKPSNPSTQNSPPNLYSSSSLHVKQAFNDTFVISASHPHATLRAVNQKEGVLWHIDFRTNPELGSGFNPCSVSASETGDIYFADASTEKFFFLILL